MNASLDSALPAEEGKARHGACTNATHEAWFDAHLLEAPQQERSVYKRLPPHISASASVKK
jgi:hypothetical protein